MIPPSILRSYEVILWLGKSGTDCPMTVCIYTPEDNDGAKCQRDLAFDRLRNDKPLIFDLLMNPLTPGPHGLPTAPWGTHTVRRDSESIPSFPLAVGTGSKGLGYF